MENAKALRMQAVFTDPNGLNIRETPIPEPTPNQALIKVKAFSLNQGETRTALAATNAYTPGWDFAGVIERAAADGSTPKEGTRVFGYIARGSWAEYLVAPGGLMAEIPAGVSDAQAASLPITGMTALACLDATGALFDRRILITGAAGGVGRLACQLAALAGAKVSVVSRRPGLLKRLQDDGIAIAGIFSSVEDAKAAGEYDVIWDSIGGDTLATALTALARNGICVNYGNSARQPTAFDVRAAGWPMHGIQCIWLGREPIYDSTPLLARLVEMVKDGRLHTAIDAGLAWTDVAVAAQRLVQGQVEGKIILHVSQ